MLLVILSPLFTVIAIAVRVTSAGPIIYRQVRIGKDGKKFTIFKFRSMRDNSRREGADLVAVDDERLTRIGRLLRRTGLDELPQLWNVLTGSMTLVGPRPVMPEVASEILERDGKYRLRFEILPGITGESQILGYFNDPKDYEQSLKCDLDYIRGRSLLGDLRILARTIPLVLRGRGH